VDLPVVATLAVIAALAYLLIRCRKIKPKIIAPPKPRIEAVAAEPSKTETAETPPLAVRLQQLAQVLDGPADATVHPREVVDLPQFQLAVAAFSAPEVPLTTLRQYALGENWPLACAAFFVLARHPERDSLANLLLAQLDKLRPWTLLYALRYLAALRSRPPVGAPLCRAREYWAENLVIPDEFREYFDLRAMTGDVPEWGESLDDPRHSDPKHIAALLKRIEHPTAHILLQSLADWQSSRIDRVFLATVGRLWHPDASDQLLVEPRSWNGALGEAECAIAQMPPRSILVTGEPRVGKTAFLRILAARLIAAGWTVFEASGAEIMADQKYIGELEGRIRRLMLELDAHKRIVWHVPDLPHISTSGTHLGQTASILDQILPAIVAGRLIVLSEAAPLGAGRLFQLRPMLRALFELCHLEPMNSEAATSLATEVAARLEKSSGTRVTTQAIGSAMELADQYLGAGQMPGNVLDLLSRAVLRTAARQENSLDQEGVLATLSQITGLPRVILDDNTRIELAAVRDFFAARVIGQDEAISAVVDRIAMLKAGLTDPGRPIGVFLFAGPTGTGKTELAKTLANYLFGSPDRMARLDMSELQTPDALGKIIGSHGEMGGDSLIERIRKQPFSVVLLDEFEKAHAKVWDLCLQIFDDGRLSDANGHLADFRHTIIILTSNLGAIAHRGGALGFLPTPGTYAEEQVRRAIEQTFRPEFVNRLDKIIVFRPLSRDLMRIILRKELAAVLERRGLRRRGWAVEWEASAIEFLLDLGFSPEMGARPLKRAIDQHLLAPLAATLVEHRAPEGEQFLFVRSNGRAIEVEFVDPDAEPGQTATATEARTHLSLPTMILRPIGEEAERRALDDSWSKIKAQLAAPLWAEKKDKLQAELSVEGFWSRPDRHRVFTRLARMDRIAEAERTAERLRARLHGAGKKIPRELVTRLALQLHLVQAGIEDDADGSPVDAILHVAPALDAAADDATAAWCATLTAMYSAWAARRHMQIIQHSRRDISAPILEISGFGAWRTLQAEAGLHLLEQSDPDDSRRAVARVRIAAGPSEEPRPGEATAILTRLLAGARTGNDIIRRYRDGPAPLVRDAVAGWRSGRLNAVLDGDFDLIGAL
jgi:ATP-dependent Clp protease ATP-binding subunit ClpC